MFPSQILRELSPEVIALGPPIMFNVFPPEFFKKFRFLKPWESSLAIPEFLASHAQSVQVALVSGLSCISANILDCLPSVRLILSTSAGVDHIDLPECRRRGIAVANAGSIFSADVSDLAVGLLLDVLRKVSSADRYVRSGLWKIKGDFPFGSKMGGKCVGIVGLGSIGSEVAKRLVPFKCRISYHSRKKKSDVPYPYYSNLLQLATDSDILIICCALSNETRHMVNKEVMLALGNEGVIINIARGAIIDEDEMVQCLIRGDIAGAGLDVFENEPDVPGELCALDNVVLSPHKAVCTRESMQSLYELMMGNLEAFFSNKPLLSPVIHE